MNTQLIPDTDNVEVAKIAVAARFANSMADKLLNHGHKVDTVGTEWAKHFKQTYNAIDEAVTGTAHSKSMSSNDVAEKKESERWD